MEGRPPRFVAGVDVGAAVEEGGDDSQLTGVRSQHQRRAADTQEVIANGEKHNNQVSTRPHLPSLLAASMKDFKGSCLAAPAATSDVTASVDPA